MHALKVQINDEAPIVAGAEDMTVLHTIINCVGRLGDRTRHARPDEGADLFLSVGGLTARPPEVPDEHLYWLSHRQLQTGDVVRVELLETSTADAPVGGKEAEKRKHDEREYFEHCRKAYFALREKYEAA
jgi:hypothetical protein